MRRGVKVGNGGNARKSRKNKNEKGRKKNKVTFAGRLSVQDGQTARDRVNLNLILSIPHVENGGGKINSQCLSLPQSQYPQK